MFSPVCGASEFLTMKHSLSLLQKKEVVYCMEENGMACKNVPNAFGEKSSEVIEEQHQDDFSSYNRRNSYISKKATSILWTYF